jgi:ABC-type dipeptide/oligopeptide/nickel transport system permease subunit
MTLPDRPGLPEDAAGAPVTSSADAGAADPSARPRSLSSDAWHDLRHSAVFWVSASIALVMVLLCLFPQLFSRIDARTALCSLSDSMRPPDADHWFGYDKQGCDVYARVVYGARSSVLVGVFSTLLSGVIALVVGMLAGFYGGWIDAMLARLVDIVLGIPVLLGAIVVAKALSGQDLGIWPVVLAIGLLGWTVPARVIRSSVIAARQQDYVQAARILGAGNGRIMLRHILPNALAPVIVVLMISLGCIIALEATLSFLGVEARDTISWGADIAEAQRWIREASHPLLFPAGFLTLTVLAFIMLGDAVREAFDPRLR